MRHICSRRHSTAALSLAAVLISAFISIPRSIPLWFSVFGGRMGLANKSGGAAHFLAGPISALFQD
jgi:hypothetical protein